MNCAENAPLRTQKRIRPDMTDIYAKTNLCDCARSCNSAQDAHDSVRFAKRPQGSASTGALSEVTRLAAAGPLPGTENWKALLSSSLSLTSMAAVCISTRPQAALVHMAATWNAALPPP
jgi:hypothetical protein